MTKKQLIILRVINTGLFVVSCLMLVVLNSVYESEDFNGKEKVQEKIDR